MPLLLLSTSHFPDSLSHMALYSVNVPSVAAGKCHWGFVGSVVVEVALYPSHSEHSLGDPRLGRGHAMGKGSMVFPTQ